jgi:hypothetical protein
MRDIVPRGYATHVDYTGFALADEKTRMETYELGLKVGAYTHEEVRKAENKPPAPAPEPIQEPAVSNVSVLRERAG